MRDRAWVSAATNARVTPEDSRHGRDLAHQIEVNIHRQHGRTCIGAAAQRRARGQALNFFDALPF